MMLFFFVKCSHSGLSLCAIRNWEVPWQLAQFTKDVEIINAYIAGKEQLLLLYATPPPNFTDWLYTLGQVSCVTHYTLNILWIHTRTRADCIHKSSSSSSPFLLLHTCFFCKTTEEHEEGAATHSDDSEGSHLGQSCTAAGPMECTFSWFWYKHRSSMFVFEFNAVHSLFSHLLFARKIATPHIRAGLSFLSYRKTSKQTK